MPEARIAWAIQEDEFVHISQAPPSGGLAAGCRCIECGGDLMPVHGKVQTPHFRHYKPEGCPLAAASGSTEGSFASSSGRVAVRIIRAVLENIGSILLPKEYQPRAIVDRHIGETAADGLILDLLEIETSSGAPRIVAVEMTATRRLGSDRLAAIKALGEDHRLALEQEMESRGLSVMVICGDPRDILGMSPQDLREWLVAEGQRFWLPGARRLEAAPSRPIPEAPRQSEWSVPIYPEPARVAGLPAPVVPPWLAGLEPLEPPMPWPHDMDMLTRQRHMAWFARQDAVLAESFADLPVHHAKEMTGTMPSGLTTRMGLHMARLVPGGDPVGWLVWVGQCVALFSEKKARKNVGTGTA